MGAIDDRRLDPLDAFDKLVKVGVIGKGNRVIDSQPPSPGRIDGPSGDAGWACSLCALPWPPPRNVVIVETNNSGGSPRGAADLRFLEVRLLVGGPAGGGLRRGLGDGFARGGTSPLVRGDRFVDETTQLD